VRDDEKFQRTNMQSANHFSLIRSILIDSGPPTVSRQHFFANYFCAVHEAVRRENVSLQKRVFASRIGCPASAAAKNGRANNPYFIGLFEWRVFWRCCFALTRCQAPLRCALRLSRSIFEIDLGRLHTPML
jgi:hypothetical protein